MIDGETIIEESGRYELEDDIELDHNAPWVIRINADDVRLDGNGHTIRTTDGRVEFGGIDAHSVKKLRIRNVRLADLNTTGMDLSQLSKSTIAGCESVNCATGITVSGDNDGLRIRNCELHDSLWDGINILGDRPNVKIVSNTLHDNGDNGIRMHSAKGCDITGNTIEDNGRYGIEISRSDDNKITGNQFCGHEEAIKVDEESSGNKITGNHIC